MVLNRRKFLTASSSAMALATVPHLLQAGMSQATEPENWSVRFQAALREKPWLSGFESAAQEQYKADAVITGHWPDALRGTLYRNGPAQHEVGGFRYQHCFDGDGMIHAYGLSSEGVAHQAKMIQTRKYQAEKLSGRAMYPTFGSIPPNPAAVTSPDVMNVANISVLPHHGKLMALWEAGSPWEIDPETLDSKGAYSFSDNTRGVPFSAHPRVEPDGTMWNFGYLSSANMLVLWHIDAKGKIVKMGKVSSDPMSMPHDFVVTDKHIVIMMPPFDYSHQERPTAFLNSHEWHSDQASRVLVVDKSDFSNFRWLELPSQRVFHYGNAWEDRNGVIYFDGARAKDPRIMTNGFRDVMQGIELTEHVTRHYQYRLDTKNWTISEQAIMDANVHSEFPVIDPRVSTQRYRRLVVMTSNHNSRLQPTPYPKNGQLNEVSCFDLESGKLVSYRYPDTQIPEEHLFVPKPNSALETDGWIIGTAHNWQTQSTLLNVFDIQAVDAGPIATATLPYAMPLGLHGKFV